MKIIITEQQAKFLAEEYNDESDYFHLYDETVMEVFNSIKNQQKITFHKINPAQYQTALRDFMRFPRNPHFVRFPTKYVFRWKSMMIEGVVLLDALTSIHGHSQYFPYDEFYDVFNYTESYQSDQYNLFTGELEEVTPDGEYTAWAKKRYQETGNKDYLKDYDWSSVYEYLDDVMNIDDYVPFFESGHAVMSDFGLEPLRKLVLTLLGQDRAEDIIITINKMLDVTHPRGDLAELFIKGGSKSLDFIAGFEKEEQEYA